MKYIKFFDELTLKDISLVGGKNASLGQMIAELSEHNIRVPQGFAITVDAYWHYLKVNNLFCPIDTSMHKIKRSSTMPLLRVVAKEIRTHILNGIVPDDLYKEIITAYHHLSIRYFKDACDVAVRSSATVEDSPYASFAGQQNSYLNIVGEKNLIESYKKCLASLFTDRAIAYRLQHKFNYATIALSVGVQKMIRADLGCAGVSFSLDTETGFKDIVMIEGSYGLGESIVQGLVNPDSFIVYKPMLKKGFKPILKKKLGQKTIKMVYTNGKESTHTVPVSQDEQNQFVLNDKQILELARAVSIIEDHYSHVRNCWSPMDVEWAIDGIDNLLYIVQARPETVYANKVQYQTLTFKQSRLTHTGQIENIITSGLSIGTQIVSGVARVIKDTSEIDKVRPGDIIVTQMTNPDWIPVMKKAVGIVTNKGGRTCHAAIVSRELGIPAIVGVQDAIDIINDGEMITLDCSRGVEGFILEGLLSYVTDEMLLSTIPVLPAQIMLNLANPDNAFTVSFLPTAGVGLVRIEFIIANTIKIHPMALLYPEKIDDPHIHTMIDTMTQRHESKIDFFIDQLAQGIAMIAAAFFPRPVVVRFSDFKSNEYRELIGGRYFELFEENPMLGLRGASRYYTSSYSRAFALECAAIERVRNKMGLTNVKVMIPFVRTFQEAELVLYQMSNNNLYRHQNGLEVIMMCEVPANVLLIEQFSQLFDGFSIGSNDLTQLVLGVDRDSPYLAHIFDEQNPAVTKMIAIAIDGARRNSKPIGICGQGPSDFPEMADFLMQRGISSISLNPDTVLSFLSRYIEK